MKLAGEQDFPRYGCMRFYAQWAVCPTVVWCTAGTMDDESGQRKGAGKRSRGAGGGYGAGMRARSASGGGGRAHKEAADPMREAVVQDEEDAVAIERAQREARIVQLAITCAGRHFRTLFTTALPSLDLLSGSFINKRPPDSQYGVHTVIVVCRPS